jgi:hypothetical protein
MYAGTCAMEEDGNKGFGVLMRVSIVTDRGRAEHERGAPG